MEKEIKIFITLGQMKIQSINSMYKAGLISRNGKKVPYIYKSAESKKVSDIMTEALRGIDWTPHLDWLRNTPQFTVTQNYVFKAGISRRDTGNCEKLISDVLVRFIHNELGIESFDDSKFTDLHLYKSIIPGAQHEYICISIKPSMFNTRIDQTPSPTCIQYDFPLPAELSLKELKSKHKDKGLRFKFSSGEGNYIKASTTDTEVILLREDPGELIEVFKKIQELGECRFMFLGIPNDSFLGLGDFRGVKVKKTTSPKELVEWILEKPNI